MVSSQKRDMYLILVFNLEVDLLLFCLFCFHVLINLRLCFYLPVAVLLCSIIIPFQERHREHSPVLQRHTRLNNHILHFMLVLLSFKCNKHQTITLEMFVFTSQFINQVTMQGCQTCDLRTRTGTSTIANTGRLCRVRP